MISEVANEAEFKKICRQAWKSNAPLWLEDRKLPLKLRYYLANLILKDDSNPVVLDIGCGNGWLFHEILNFNADFRFKYTGLDINDVFINYLKEKVKDSRAQFLLTDFEEELLSITDNSVDKAVAVLSFIEMTDLRTAFSNVFKKLKDDGTCTIVVLNPYLELTRLNSDFADLKNDLSVFRSGKMYYYEKKIISSDFISEVNYYGLLHHIDNYFSISKENGLLVTGFREIDAIDEMGPGSTVYHCIEFKKI